MRRKKITEEQLQAARRVVIELVGSGMLKEQGEPIALVVDPDLALLSRDEQETLVGCTRRLTARSSPPGSRWSEDEDLLGQRAAAERQASRIERTIAEAPEAYIREKAGPSAERLAGLIRARGVPLAGRDIAAAQEALRTGAEPRFSEAYVRVGGIPSRGLNPLSETLSEEETTVLKDLIERACSKPRLFADAAGERILRRTHARIRERRLPQRRVLAEPGSIELPADVFSDLLDVGKPVDGRFDEVLQGCEMADLAVLVTMLYMFDRRQALVRGWNFQVDDDGEPWLDYGMSRLGPLPSQSDPDGHVSPGWRQSILRLTRLGWFKTDRSCKRIGRGERLRALDELRGVEIEKPAEAVAS